MCSRNSEILYWIVERNYHEILTERVPGVEGEHILEKLKETTNVFFDDNAPPLETILEKSEKIKKTIRMEINGFMPCLAVLLNFSPETHKAREFLKFLSGQSDMFHKTHKNFSCLTEKQQWFLFQKQKLKIECDYTPLQIFRAAKHIGVTALTFQRLVDNPLIQEWAHGYKIHTDCLDLVFRLNPLEHRELFVQVDGLCKDLNQQEKWCLTMAFRDILFFKLRDYCYYLEKPREFEIQEKLANCMGSSPDEIREQLKDTNFRSLFLYQYNQFSLFSQLLDEVRSDQTIHYS